MKKIFVVFVSMLGIVIFAKDDARAMVVGDEIIIGESYTAIPFTKFQLGGAAEFTLDKDLEPKSGEEEIDIEGSRFLLKPTISLFENVDLYAKIGLGSDKLNNATKKVKIESEIGPAYGGGLRANLMNWEDIGLHIGMDAQYLRFDTGIDIAEISGISYSSASGDFIVKQWQLAAFIVKEFFQVTVYAGGSYGDSEIDYDYDTAGLSDNDIDKNENNLGALGGVNIHITDAVVFFAEGHFFDETNLALGLNARF